MSLISSTKRSVQSRFQPTSGSSTFVIVAGRTGSFEFATPETGETRAAQTITIDSDDLRRACVYLAGRVPDGGLVETLNALWRINEFHSVSHPALLPPGAPDTRRTARIAHIGPRPAVWLAED